MATKKAPAKAPKKATSAKVKAKSPTKGAAAKKPPSKSAKPAAKTTKAAKAPAKQAPKAKPKPVAKAAPATKPAAKPLAKGPAVTPSAKGKAAKETQKKEPPKKELPKKKLNVGQKPRSARADLPLKPQTFITAPAPTETTGASAPKITPASKEAKQTFKVNDSVVYPAHGVGRIVSIEKQIIAGITNELFVLDFEQEKLKLKVPTAKAISSGMRALSDEAQVKKAIDLLKGRARIKRTMWSRRAQEYEAKINSGDIMSVAEVVRDLYRATDQPEQSYSERQLFEAALDRLAREVAAVRKCDLAKALGDLDASLQQKKAA